MSTMKRSKIGLLAVAVLLVFGLVAGVAVAKISGSSAISGATSDLVASAALGGGGGAGGAAGGVGGGATGGGGADIKAGY